MLLKYTMMCLNRWSVSPELLKFCFLSALLALCSCQDQPASVDQRGSEDREPVVSVGQDTLYEANLAAMTTNFEAQREDEARLREEYIDRWIKRKLVYQKALDNLSPQQKDKDQALQRYYETLIRHTYQQSLLRQKLDQELSTDTLKAYYEANQSRFRLSAPVLKIRYLAVPPSAPDQSKLTDPIRITTWTRYTGTPSSMHSTSPWVMISGSTILKSGSASNYQLRPNHS